MRTLEVTVTLLENEDDAKKFLLDVGVKGPSLHPHVNSDSSYHRWNGWNYAKAIGVDAGDRFVAIESWHFARDGRVDFAVSINGGTGHLGGGCFNRIQWPVQAFPALAVIEHPEYTPTDDKPRCLRCEFVIFEDKGQWRRVGTGSTICHRNPAQDGHEPVFTPMKEK